MFPHIGCDLQTGQRRYTSPLRPPRDCVWVLQPTPSHVTCGNIWRWAGEGWVGRDGRVSAGNGAEKKFSFSPQDQLKVPSVPSNDFRSRSVHFTICPRKTSKFLVSFSPWKVAALLRSSFEPKWLQRSNNKQNKDNNPTTLHGDVGFYKTWPGFNHQSLSFYL